MSQTPKERTHEEVHSHSNDKTPKRVIMITIDDSESAKYTIDFALNSIVSAEDEVVLVNCRPPAFNEFNIELGYPYVIANDDMIKAEEHLKLLSHSLLKRVAKRFQDLNFHVRAVSMRGDARQELEYKAENLGPAFVMIGSRGLGMVSRALLGSVSTYLVNHLHCPVMVVPMPKK